VTILSLSTQTLCQPAHFRVIRFLYATPSRDRNKPIRIAENISSRIALT